MPSSMSNKLLQPAMQASGIRNQMLSNTLSGMLPTKMSEATALSAYVQTELMAAAHAGCYLTADPSPRVSQMHAGQMQALLMLKNSRSKAQYFRV